MICHLICQGLCQRLVVGFVEEYDRDVVMNIMDKQCYGRIWPDTAVEGEDV